MVVGRAGRSPVMVGRGPELAELVALLDRPADAVEPSVALVGGEAGVGKSRLVRELLAEVPSGHLVLAGQAEEGSLGRPLEVLFDAIDGEDGPDGAPLRDHELARRAADRDRHGDERVQAAVDLVRELLADRPGVIAFEDLHWADAESVALFERLATVPCTDLVLVGTYRPDGLTRRRPATEMLPRLDRRHAVTHVRLDRLGPEDVEAFLVAVYGRAPSYRVIDRLQLRSGGNPFFLEELLGRTTEADLDQLDRQPLPWSLTEVIGHQLDDLPPEARQVAEAAAVLGRRVTFDVLAEVTGRSEVDLIACLRTLVDQGLMAEDEPDVFSFRHALAQEAIEAGLLGRERRRLHEAAVDALRKQDAPDLAAITGHLYGAGRYGELTAVATEAAQTYLDRGAAYQALELAELGLSEDGDVLDLVSIAAEAAWRCEQLPEAIAYGARWMALAEASGDPSRLAGALRNAIRIGWESGEIQRVADAADRLARLVDDLPSDEERTRAMAALAQASMLLVRRHEAIAWADRAAEQADRIGRRDLWVAAQVEKGSALMFDHETAREGGSLLLDVAEEAEQLGLHVLAARALNNLLWRAYYAVDLPQVTDWIEHMRDQAERAGLDTLSRAGYAQLMAANAAFEGDLDGAIAALADGRTPTARAAAGYGRWFAVAQAGFALEAGDLDAAARFTAEAKPLPAKNQASITGLEIHLAARRGDLATTRALLPDLIDAVTHGLTTNGLEPGLFHDVTSACLAVGIQPAELALFRELFEQPDEDAIRLDPEGGWRALVDGQLAEADGRTDEALAHYRRAIDTLPQTLECWPAHRATALVGAARCLLAAKRADEARPLAVEARRLLLRWRGWRVEALEAVERRLGIGDRSGPAGDDELTPREREVALLVADGLSNAALARKLFISPKTASVHVSNILAKLGMTSRTEIAAWVLRRERGAPPLP